MMEYRYIATPLGSLVAVADNNCLKELCFVEQYDVLRLAKMHKVDQAHALLDLVCEQLQEYFEGTRRIFTIPLEIDGTDFQKKVWQSLCEVGYGSKVAYQDIARAICHDKAVRAVGLANGKNPILIVIPCHRVVRLSGHIGGYAAGLDRKMWLLRHEKNRYELPSTCVGV